MFYLILCTLISSIEYIIKKNNEKYLNWMGNGLPFDGHEWC